MFEFGFGAKKYRDDLANELVEIRNDDEEKSGVTRADAVDLLKKEQKTEKYKYSKDLLKGGLKSKNEIFQSEKIEKQIEDLEWGSDFGGIDMDSFIMHDFSGYKEVMSDKSKGWYVPTVEALRFAFINQLPGFEPACYWSSTRTRNGLWDDYWCVDMRTGREFSVGLKNNGEKSDTRPNFSSDYRVRFVRNNE